MENKDLKKLTEQALEPLKAQKEYLSVFVRRGYPRAKWCVEQFNKFDKEKNEIWDMLLNDYNQTCVYGLPNHIYKNTCNDFKKKLLKVLYTINEQIPYCDRQSMKLKLGVKLYAYHAYGFLTDGKMIALEG